MNDQFLLKRMQQNPTDEIVIIENETWLTMEKWHRSKLVKLDENELESLQWVDRLIAKDWNKIAIKKWK